MNAVNPGNPGLKLTDIGGGASGRTNIDLDALGRVTLKMEPLRAELDGLIKQWDESTERYHAAAGSDDMNGNLKQQSTQAKQDADQHSKATSERAQKAADTSKEAHAQYSGVEDDNHTELKKPGDHLSGGGGANFNAPAATQAGADSNASAATGGPVAR
ncbi:hypothetical protein Srot_0253 [Segniliparus rotundus DSM 44985]|uniref:Uncharacterized protein n=1 Tax=Segniliparus rotundus (strain ATCC BAA-972 / CDC 1076 / CIP 108378 / DSM 44985 / JCM 13578) TaxID=640132 RepID=D6ZAY1_SEGRD|nr:hypothetical protein [Segniliparus rotundus]ADG96740.1 hypothetical protein Srot_0253 [Segniliparus rotundus DSM 44985]